MGDAVNRVLVVEDSPAQALLMHALLEDEGLAVAVARDGVEAQRCIHASAPDVIVTDLHMVVMGGVALTEAGRRAFPFVPVVLVTYLGIEQVVAQALRPGAVSYVPRLDIATDLLPTLNGVLAVAMRTAGRWDVYRTCRGGRLITP